MTADSYCQYHYGLFGLMLFNEGNGYSEMGLLLSQYDSPFELNRLSYEISFASVIPNANQSAPSSYDFCVVNGHNCSIVMIWMADTKKQVSDMYLTLVEAACVDTFTTEHWSKLENTPPATLQENYFTCTQFWYNAAFDSLGIASVWWRGNFRLHTMCLIVELYCFYCFATGCRARETRPPWCRW